MVQPPIQDAPTWKNKLCLSNAISTESTLTSDAAQVFYGDADTVSSLLEASADVDEQLRIPMSALAVKGHLVTWREPWIHFFWMMDCDVCDSWCFQETLSCFTIVCPHNVGIYQVYKFTSHDLLTWESSILLKYRHVKWQKTLEWVIQKLNLP